MSSVETILLAPARDSAHPALVADAPAGMVQVAGTTASLSADIVRDRDALRAIGPEWDALFDRAGSAHQVFQTHGFVSLWADCFVPAETVAGHGDSCSCELSIVILRRNGRLVLVWPLVVQRRWGVRILSWLGEPFGQYADLIIDPNEPALPAMRRAWQHVRSIIAPDVVRLRRVRRDSSLLPLIEELAAVAMNPHEAPFVSLGPAAGSGGFDGQQSGKAKKNRRRLLRRLEEAGNVSFVRASGTAEAQRLAREALGIKRDWVVRRGLLAPAMADARFDALTCATAGAGAAASGCSLFALTVDGRIAAAAIGFRCKDRLMLHLITHAAEVEKFGAGVLNLEQILRTAERDGLAAVDLLPPTADYKLQWADGVMSVADYSLATTVTGRVYIALVDRLVKPLARCAFDLQPLLVRQWLARHQFRHV